MDLYLHHAPSSFDADDLLSADTCIRVHNSTVYVTYVARILDHMGYPWDDPRWRTVPVYTHAEATWQDASAQLASIVHRGVLAYDAANTHRNQLQVYAEADRFDTICEVLNRAEAVGLTVPETFLFPTELEFYRTVERGYGVPTAC